MSSLFSKLRRSAENKCGQTVNSKLFSELLPLIKFVLLAVMYSVPVGGYKVALSYARISGGQCNEVVARSIRLKVRQVLAGIPALLTELGSLFNVSSLRAPAL